MSQHMTIPSSVFHDKTLLRNIFSLISGLFLFCILDVQNLSASEISYWKDVDIEKQINYPDRWFYALEEIERQYIVDYEDGKRLSNFITKKNGTYTTSCNSENIIIPEAFVAKTLELIQALLEQGLVRYIFRLDAFHGHLFVPENVFIKKYTDMTTEEMIKHFSNEDSLGMLFHNAEHLALRNPPAEGPVVLQAKALIEKRNVIGWYDDRPLKVIELNEDLLLTDRKNTTATIPEGYRNVGVITFMATRNGEFSIIHNGEEIRIDISPYECYYH